MVRPAGWGAAAYAHSVRRVPHLSDPTVAGIADVFRHLLAGDIDVREAARRLIQLAPNGPVAHLSLLSPEEQLRLDALAPALQWEMAKKVVPSLPDVPYGSPQYQEFMAKCPTYHFVPLRLSFWGHEMPRLSRLVEFVFTRILRRPRRGRLARGGTA